MNLTQEQTIALLSASSIGFSMILEQDETLAKQIAEGMIALQENLDDEIKSDFLSDKDIRMVMALVKVYSEL
jgi:hypothetical protein